MNARRNIAVASLLLALSTTAAYAGDFRNWLLSDAPLWMQDPRPMKVAEGLGSASEQCLDCHNGTSASKITATHGNGFGGWSSRGSGSHPVGMDYASAASRHRNGYHPLGALPAAIVLESGRVTCTSCHRVEMKRPRAAGFIKVAAWTRTLRHAPHTSRLTVGPRETDLCLACHIK